MKLCEILDNVDDVELQRVTMLKNNAKQANQQPKDARARQEIEKARQAMPRAQVQSAIGS